MHLFLNKALLFVLLIGSVDTSYGYGESMTDLFQKRELSKADKVLILYTDLDNDGNKEIWVSTNAWMNSRFGNMWTTFENTSNGMMKVNTETRSDGTRSDGVSFRDDAYNVTYVEELGKRAIVAYLPGGGHRGSLMAYTLEKNKIKTTKLRELRAGDAWEGDESYLKDDKKVYEKYFHSEKEVKINYLAKQDFIAQLENISGEDVKTKTIRVVEEPQTKEGVVVIDEETEKEQPKLTEKVGVEQAVDKSSEALDKVIYEKLLDIIYDRSKEGWEYSGSGGYMFRCTFDVAGDKNPETMVRFSIETPPRWFLFSDSTTNDNKKYLGELNLPGIGGMNISNKNKGISKLFETYYTTFYVRVPYNFDATPFKPFEGYILEEEISEEGIKKYVRVVGKDATIKEFLALSRYKDNPEGVIYLIPKTEFISLWNLLMDKDPEWLEFRFEEWVSPHGHFLHRQDAVKVNEVVMTSDEERIKELIGNFTPELAIEHLQSRIRAIDSAEAKPDAVDRAEEPSAINTQ